MKLTKELSGLDLGGADIMQRSTLKRLIATSTGNSKVQQFSLWAFGKKIDQDFEIRDMVRLWNHRRGGHYDIDIEKIDPDSIDMMVNIWRENYSPMLRERSASDASPRSRLGSV
jgi:hypothetical protein